jgi:hypothetical protein
VLSCTPRIIRPQLNKLKCYGRLSEDLCSVCKCVQIHTSEAYTNRHVAEAEQLYSKCGLNIHTSEAYTNRFVAEAEQVYSKCGLRGPVLRVLHANVKGDSYSLSYEAASDSRHLFMHNKHS